MLDRGAIGRRIKEARKLQGLSSPGALAKAMQEKLQAGNKTTGRKLARQTVETWERGQIIPPWDKVELMATVFRPEHDEAWIMFGPRRSEQLRDQTTLVRISRKEIELLQIFRGSNDEGQKSILTSARAFAAEHPAEIALVHQIRRQGDG